MPETILSIARYFLYAFCFFKDGVSSTLNGMTTESIP